MHTAVTALATTIHAHGRNNSRYNHTCTRP